MIEITGATKVFGKGLAEVRAVDDVNLLVREGDFVLIMGRSGSGKSTLLGIIAGLITPTTGIVNVSGRDINAIPEDQGSEMRAKTLGFVFQFSGLIPTLTVTENVMLPTLFCKDTTDCGPRVVRLLEKVGMSDRADAYPHTLSSGEMKRVAIARALVNNPLILIADEPTGDLDVDTEYEIMELFKSINDEGTTIVMVTHNPDLAPYATKTYLMKQGKLIGTASPFSSSKMMSDPAVHRRAEEFPWTGR